MYPTPGAYNVTTVVYSKCYSDTAKKIITIQSTPSVHVPAVIKDTSLCVGAELNVNVSTANATSYLWENGLILPERKIEKAGVYRLTMQNECSGESKNFRVTYNE